MGGRDRLGRRRFTPLAALGAGALLLLAGWLLRPRQPLNLMLPLAPSIGSAYLELAATRQLGHAHGLELQTIQREDGSQLVRDYLKGNASVVPLSGAEAISICEQLPQRCPQLVLVLSASRGGDSVQVRPDLVNVSGLRGQPVGISPENGGLWLLRQALQASGLDLRDVQLVPVPASDMPRQLGRRQLGGAVLAPPFREQTQMLGDSRRLFDSQDSPITAMEFLAVEPSPSHGLIASLEALVLAWQAAHLLAAADPGEALPVLGWATHLSPSGFLRAERGFSFFGLEAQRQLLAPGGSVAVHLATLQRIGQGSNPGQRSTLLPGVSDSVVAGALRLQANRSLPK